jgi:AraC-like DNA-binding protein
MGPSVLASVTRHLVDAAVRLGVSREAVLSRAGLEEEALSDADARVPFGSHMTVWQLLVHAAGGRDIGIELGRELPLSSLGVLGHALGQARTLRDALPFYRRCAPLVSDLFMPHVAERDGRVVFEAVTPPAFVPLRHPAEMCLAAAVTLVRALTEVSWPILAVRFQHAAPPSRAGVIAFFGHRVEFGAPSSRVELDAAALSAPIRKADPRLFEYLTRHAEALTARLPEPASVAERLRREIASALREGEPPQEWLARRFGMSGRTLQRRLKEEGTSFARVVDETRRDLAMLYLGEPRLSAAEVSFLLGYAEPTAFFRAFRRWTGATPREYRTLAARPAGAAAARIPARAGA